MKVNRVLHQQVCFYTYYDPGSHNQRWCSHRSPLYTGAREQDETRQSRKDLSGYARVQLLQLGLLNMLQILFYLHFSV